MSTAMSNSSLARSRSIRSNTVGSLKPSSTAALHSTAGPSNISLFLTNLRLLDLDLLTDWPDITASALSAKDAKKRSQCVEWALYQLFVLWDPEEARNKLQPFFPPLEPLQSLNLRAALYRCLEQAKKAGMLGRDIILRKTMLDECKGERLEEVLAVFSNAVLKKVLQESESDGHEAIAHMLALENFSYSGERTVLSALILAHKASLSKHLREKKGLRTQYTDLEDLLNLNERRITRRHEQLRQILEERDDHGIMSTIEVGALQRKVQTNWSGANEWLEAIVYGDSRANTDGVLGTPFDTVWNAVETGMVGDLKGKKHVGLLEQLEARLQDQEARLARWQDFGKTLSKNGSATPARQKDVVTKARAKIDLGFTRHQSLQVGRGDSKVAVASSSVSLDDYNRIIEKVQAELADVGKLRPSMSRSARNSIISLPNSSPRRSIVSISQSSPMASPQLPKADSSDRDEEWSSASETEETLPVVERANKKPAERVHPTMPRLVSPQQSPPEFSPEQQYSETPNSRDRNTHEDFSHITNTKFSEYLEDISVIEPRMRTPSPIETHSPQEIKIIDAEAALADQILNSVSAASPSPKKRHTLSLAERTRLSMSRTSHSKYSDSDSFDGGADLPQLTPKTSQTQSSPIREPEVEKHADLIERTRQSMAGFEAAQQKAQIARRRTRERCKEEATRVKLEAAELIEGDPNYADVFKSRPKIKTSPAVSPMRVWEEEEEEDKDEA